MSTKELEDQSSPTRNSGTNTTVTTLFLCHFFNEKADLISNTHPETNEPIPLVCRWSAYVPMNIPITIGMILSDPKKVKINKIFLLFNIFN